MSEQVDSSAAYRSFGVDLDLGNDASKYAYEASLHTHANRAELFGEPEMLGDTFASQRIIDFGRIRDVESVKGSESADGIGTKPEIAERLLIFNTLAFDLYAMAADDLAAAGGEPAWVTAILDVNVINERTMPYIRDLALGTIAAAAAAQIAVFTGETAELGDRVGGYGEFHLNWNAVVSGAIHRERVITGQKIKQGDTLVGIADPGFRSNGISAVRKIFKRAYGEEWHEETNELGQRIGELALTPSVIYSKMLVDATGGYDERRQERVPLHGVAHVTGGGIPEKLGRALHESGLGAVISEPFELPDIQRLAQEKAIIEEDGKEPRKMTDRELYATWHGGQGLIGATPEPAKLIALANEHGMEAKEIGEVTKQSSILIKSAGIHTPGQYQEWERAA